MIERHPLQIDIVLTTDDDETSFQAALVLSCDLLGAWEQTVAVPIGNLPDPVGTLGTFPTREAALRRAVEQMAQQWAALGKTVPR